ncbi:LysE family transporter [Marivirga atlantica]|jgi:threonine/homoserine/homoserine lactone efflux protein|uniref:LysE family translocator n=1 Tax=Marivirga atlantica TaxID=1548457 RepID=A0A937APG7_9BACT|nr:LysE family translocator [Marivirga atlantica]MBL0766422.1 LysE family translocator [Marivirga atlantica]
MSSIILEGVLFGLLLAVMIGPVFFALIQNSIEKGMKAGVIMALGIAIADVSYILLMYFSVKLFRNNPTVSVVFGAVGGLIMLLTGVYSFLKKNYKIESDVKTTKKGVLKQFIKGFVLNGINPFVLMYWLGVMTLVTVKNHYSHTEIISFFSAIIGTLLITDVTKVALAQRLRNFITVKRLKIMNRVVGVALILFSFRLFYFAYEHFESNMFQ